MVDETTDVSNAEQLVFCFRIVDDELNSHEEFVGLHAHNNSIEHYTTTIFCKLSLSIENLL